MGDGRLQTTVTTIGRRDVQQQSFMRKFSAGRWKVGQEETAANGLKCGAFRAGIAGRSAGRLAMVAKVRERRGLPRHGTARIDDRVADERPQRAPHITEAIVSLEARVEAACEVRS